MQNLPKKEKHRVHKCECNTQRMWSHKEFLNLLVQMFVISKLDPDVVKQKMGPINTEAATDVLTKHFLRIKEGREGPEDSQNPTLSCDTHMETDCRNWSVFFCFFSFDSLQRSPPVSCFTEVCC